MPGPFTGTPKALGFFGSVLAATDEGATTAGIWDAMKASALDTAAALSGFVVGSAIPPIAVLNLAQSMLSGISIFDVNQMRGIAGQNVAAARALASSPLENVIDSSMIAIPPSFATGPGTGLPQKYSLRVNFTGVDQFGNEASDWYTIYDVDVTTPVGALYDMALADANARADAGVGSVQVVSVSSVNRVDLSQV
jgi:hypothetical protein